MASKSSVKRLKGFLSVTILQASNLMKSDWIGENDVYAVVSIEPLELETVIKTRNRKEQSEAYQITQIRDGCHPIFNEKLLFPVPNDLHTLYVQLWDSDHGKDDLLAHGTVNLLDDDQGGDFDTNMNKEWLHTTKVSLLNPDGESGGSLELVLHFIPESVAEYMVKHFNSAQAELKKKIKQKIVSTVTDAATDQIRGFVGIDS